MKKLTITLAMILAVAINAFAGDGKIKTEVLSAFQSKFSNATEVSWTAGSTYYKAAFNYQGMWLSAYYNESAQLIGTSRNIVSTQLPYYLQNNLKNKYASFWITDLFEVSNNDGFRYYVTLQSADNTITLISINGADWNLTNAPKN